MGIRRPRSLANGKTARPKIREGKADLVVDGGMFTGLIVPRFIVFVAYHNYASRKMWSQCVRDTGIIPQNGLDPCGFGDGWFAFDVTGNHEQIAKMRTYPCVFRIEHSTTATVGVIGQGNTKKK